MSNKDEKQQIGIITEVGDLGLGFEELSNEDQKKLEKKDK